MIFDGDCRFCSLWIRRWRHITGEAIDYLPSQDPTVAAQFPELSQKQFAASVQLVDTDGSVRGGANAVFYALAHNPRHQLPLDWYEQWPVFAGFTERAYGFVARHRTFFSFLTRLGWGQHTEPPSQLLVRWLFLRGVGLIYLIAFVSLWVQVIGLVGQKGILPAKAVMESMRQQAQVRGVGLDRYHEFPTLCWLGASDASLKLQCAAGTALALLVILGIAPAPCLFLLWLIYLSLSTICAEFLSFQWDILLLQVGFLAIFFAPLQFLPGLKREAPPSRLVLWLLRWLMFQIMFESGLVKLLSGDPTWRNFTALNFHYETQPLPTWIGWYAFQLPEWFQKTSTALMFVIELVVPFLVFAPRRIRHFSVACFAFLQILILLTGNYCFFNLLVLALCLPLLDDAALAFITPARYRAAADSNQSTASSSRKRWRWPIQVTFPLACACVVTALTQLSFMTGFAPIWPRPLISVFQWLEPLRTFNRYGLFAVMTTSRPEIIVEGSDDGILWKEYQFKYKPGDLDRRPRFVEPHQPRLDWQMWFAALSNYRRNPWFVNFCIRLLQGSPEVLALMDRDPFPKAPPRYIRALLYEYHFTGIATRRKTGAWWRRELKGEYLPPISLKEVRSTAAAN